ncbi:hypothetical protein JMJ06_000205 [Enterococcus faecalis]|nr:hypothetical protein [Enterococcus faecalis]
MTEKEILELLDKFSEYLSQASPLLDGLRSIGMWVATKLVWILDGIGTVLSELIQLLNIFENDKFKEMLTTIEPLRWGLFFLALLAFFSLFMFGRAKNASELPINTFLTFLLIILLPFFFSTLSTMTQGLFNSFTTDFEKPGTSIVLENTTDMLLVAEDNWSLDIGESKNNFTKERQIDITEKLTEPDEIENGDPFKYKIETDKDGQDVLKEIKQPNGIAEFLAKDSFSKAYYRNRVQFFPIFLTSIIMIVAMVITAFKFAIIIVKMLGDYALLITAAPADIMGMQRIKTVLSQILGSFALIVFVPITYQIYLIAINVIKSLDFSFFTYLIALAGSSWAFLDGPNGFQQVTGIDAGLKSTGAAVAGGLFAGSRLIKSGMNIGKNLGKSAGNVLTDAGAFGLGMLTNNRSQSSSTGINERNKKGFSNEISSSDGTMKGINDKDSSSENMNELNQVQGSETNEKPTFEENSGLQTKDATLSESDSQENVVEDTSNPTEELAGINQNQENSEQIKTQGNSQLVTSSDKTMENFETPKENQDSQSNLSGLNQVKDPSTPEESNQNQLEISEKGINKQHQEEDLQDGIPTMNESTEEPFEPMNHSQDLNHSPNPSTIKDDSKSSSLQNKKIKPSTATIKSSTNDKKQEYREKTKELQLNNPLRKEIKNRTLGYDMDDPRRYHPQTTFEKKRDMYQLGKNYAEYRKQKTNLKETYKKETRDNE